MAGGVLGLHLPNVTTLLSTHVVTTVPLQTSQPPKSSCSWTRPPRTPLSSRRATTSWLWTRWSRRPRWEGS
jgi:hypothetical protein